MKVSVVALATGVLMSVAACAGSTSATAGDPNAAAPTATPPGNSAATATPATDGGPAPQPTDNRNLVTATTPPATREDAVRAFIEMDPGLRRSGWVVASFGGRVYAGVHVLGASPDGHTLYVVATAQEITLHNGVVTLASGTGDIPLRFDVTGTGSATRIIGVHTTPNSVHTSPAEARALFPEGLADRYLTRQDTAADRSDAQLLARARADAAAGTLLPS